MVADIIVGHEHERRRLILLIAQRIVVHGAVAAAVTERQHGYLAYLLRNLQHLVSLQVLDDEFVGAHQIFLLAHRIVDTFRESLTTGAQFHIHANDAVCWDADALH